MSEVRSSAADAASDRDHADSGLGGGEVVDDSGSIRDTLPDDLNAVEFVAPYVFPNNNRRRVPGVLYMVIGIGSVLLWATIDSPAVNVGFLWAGAAMCLIGVYHLVAGWELRVDENDALLVAVRDVGFPVGHASAQLGWRGWFSKPTWHILLYSNEPQPEHRGLVLVDGRDAKVLDRIVEANPEDWSLYSTH